MKIYKSNNIVKQLADAIDKKNTGKNHVLISAIGLTIFMLVCIFSIVEGKTKTDYLRNIREKGTVASVFLENANKEQYDEIEKLDYVDTIGKRTNFGIWYQADSKVCLCAVLDKKCYENLVKPAYSNIVGAYPENKNQVMLSVGLLEQLNINNPQIGMEISATIFWDDWTRNGKNGQNEKLILSGYYTDYLDSTQNLPSAYFSEQYLEVNGLNKYPAMIEIKLKLDSISGSRAESKLYNDIETQNVNQRFNGNDTAGYQSMEQFIGGYGVAFIIVMIIIGCVYLIIYNVISLSLSRDIQQFGVLSTIGTTVKQIKGIIYYQSFRRICYGLVLGGIISAIYSYCILPKLLENLYLKGLGNVEGMKIFYPQILISSMLVVILVTMIATKHSVKKIEYLSPIETYKFNDISKNKSKKVKKSKNGASLYHMAWRNITRSKRRFMITILSLFLGCEMSLCGVFITKGLDIQNKLEQNPDFIIGIQKNKVENSLFNESVPETDNRNLFKEEVMNAILDTDGIREKEVTISWGCYGGLNLDESALEPRVESLQGTLKINTAATIQVVDNACIARFKKYIKENNLKVDFDNFKCGNGILLLHKHELSKELENKADSEIGEIVHIGKEGEEGTEFICCGYLDTTNKSFPQLNMTWNGDGINYFIISEEGFEKLNLQKQVFQVAFNVEEKRETEVKNILQHLVKNENKKSESMDTYYILCNSDKIALAQKYIGASRLLMNSLSAVLIFMGIINYLNTIITSVSSRKKEFATMESIGMTRIQLKKMIRLECLYYSISILIGLLTVGIIILILIGLVIKHNMSYFKFIFPIKSIGIIILILIFLCILLPQIIYRKTIEESVIEKMRDIT